MLSFILRQCLEFQNFSYHKSRTVNYSQFMPQTYINRSKINLKKIQILIPRLPTDCDGNHTRNIPFFTNRFRSIPTTKLKFKGIFFSFSPKNYRKTDENLPYHFSIQIRKNYFRDEHPRLIEPDCTEDIEGFQYFSTVLRSVTFNNCHPPV